MALVYIFTGIIIIIVIIQFYWGLIPVTSKQVQVLWRVLVIRIFVVAYQTQLRVLSN
jgi:hypothetical protein